MKYTRAAAYARANLGAIRGMLEKSESAIERINLQDRVEDWVREVAVAEHRAATLGEADVLFGGIPVNASIGIDAAFGGQSIRAFQELVTTVAADLSPSGAEQRGEVTAAVPHLMITDVDISSFGFQLAEVPDEEPPACASPLKNALDISIRLLQAARESDDAFTRELAARPRRVLTKLEHFLDLLDEAGATLRVDTGHVSLRFDTAEHVKAARARAGTIQVEE